MPRITRQTNIRVGDLSARERAELGPRLVDIVTASFDNAPRDAVAEQFVFRTPDTHLSIIWSDETPVGFVSMGTAEYEVRGERHCVFDTGAYVLPGVHRAMPRFAVWGTSRMLRELWTRRGLTSSLVTEAASPASYTSGAAVFPSLHPRAGSTVSAEIEELVTQVIESRGFARRQDDPWRVGLETPLRFKDEARIKRFAEESTNPSVQFFLKRNPGYLRGDWLVIYVPMGLRTLATVAAAMGKQSLRNALGAKRGRPKRRPATHDATPAA